MKIMHDLRREYAAKALEPDKMQQNPTAQCALWFEEIEKLRVTDSNAATLSTYNPVTKKVRGRIVLIKEITPSGIIFFTNYESKKGQELSQHPQASLTVYWSEVFRQIRCEGSVQKISEKLSDKYFMTRPRESQAAAIASAQSSTLTDRVELEKRFNTILSGPTPLARPSNWGGYELKTDYWEFWQGRNHRLHDRISYSLQSGEWIKSRLSP